MKILTFMLFQIGFDFCKYTKNIYISKANFIFCVIQIGMTPSGLSKMIRKLSFFGIFFQLYFLILQLKTDLQTDRMTAVRENVPRPEYAAGQRRCIRRLDGGGAKIMPPFSKGDAHSNRLQNDVMVYFPWEPKFPFKPIFSKHLYFSSSKLWYPPKSLEKPQRSITCKSILI